MVSAGIINLVISIAQAMFIQYLWGMINSIQLIVFTTLFDVKIPLNAETTMHKLLALCNLDVLQIERLWNYLVDVPETDPFSDRFSAAGY